MKELLSLIAEQFSQIYNLIGPPLLTLICLSGGLGYFILDMYKFNVENKIAEAFPTQFIINFYFYFFIALMFFVVLIVIYQHILARKVHSTTSPPTDPPTPVNGSVSS